MQVTKEVRRFLLGRVFVSDGIMAVEPNLGLALLNWQGGFNGSMSSILLGVAKREITYRAQDQEEGYNELAQCFMRIGRLAAFLENEDALGCFKKNGLGNVVLYALEKDLYGEGTLTVTVFTARGLFSFLRLKRSMIQLKAQISENIGLEVSSAEEINEYRAKQREERLEDLRLERAIKREEAQASRSKNRKIDRNSIKNTKISSDDDYKNEDNEVNEANLSEKEIKIPSDNIEDEN